MLRFLADESCDFAAVRALRTEGYGVLSIAEASTGADDERVIALAPSERRILLIEDKDFGSWYSRPDTRVWVSFYCGSRQVFEQSSGRRGRRAATRGERIAR